MDPDGVEAPRCFGVLNIVRHEKPVAEGASERNGSAL